SAMSGRRNGSHKRLERWRPFSARLSAMHGDANAALPAINNLQLTIYKGRRGTSLKTGSKISPRSCPIARRSKYGFDAIAETAEFSDHLGGSTLCTRFGDKRAAFFVRDAIVQDLPHEPTQPMRDRPDRLGMAQTDDEPPVQ